MLSAIGVVFWTGEGKIWLAHYGLFWPKSAFVVDGWKIRYTDVTEHLKAMCVGVFVLSCCDVFPIAVGVEDVLDYALFFVLA